METVSTKLTGLKSKTTAWKSGWGSPRVRRVGSGGVLPSAPLSSITDTAGPLRPCSASWGRAGGRPGLTAGGLAAALAGQRPPTQAHPALQRGGAWRGSLAALGHGQGVALGVGALLAL